MAYHGLFTMQNVIVMYLSGEFIQNFLKIFSFLLIWDKNLRCQIGCKTPLNTSLLNDVILHHRLLDMAIAPIAFKIWSVIATQEVVLYYCQYIVSHLGLLTSETGYA